MPDIADKASDVVDLLLDAALKKRKQDAVKPQEGIGICLTCGEPVEGSRRWCNAQCRDEGK